MRSKHVGWERGEYVSVWRRRRRMRMMRRSPKFRGKKKMKKIRKKMTAIATTLAILQPVM